MKLGQKILLKPTQKQITVFNKAFGTARFTYNWALDKWKEKKAAGVKAVKMNDLKKEWNAIKPDWVYESPKDANQQPFFNLRTSLKNYFTSKVKGDGHFHFPKKKKKGKCKDSFYVSNDQAHITNNHIKLPLVGRVKMADRLRYRKKDLKILSYTISRTADKYYVSINFDIKDDLIKTYPTKLNMVGIDVGIKTFTVESNGTKTVSPKPLNKKLKKLKRIQRKMSRATKGSIRKKKNKKKLAELHSKIANIRKDFIHKLSRKIVNENAIICFETLDIPEMLKNHKLARNIDDAAWGMLFRFIEYKAKQTGSIVLKCDKWFPSSKTCSECMHVKEKLLLSEREFICEHCGAVIDRDLNAAINILAYCLFDLIPNAYGKFTSVEIVALVQKEIDVLSSIVDTSYRSSDGRWISENIISSLRNSVDLALANQP